MKKYIILIIFCAIGIGFFLGFSGSLFAFVMNSGNYRMEVDDSSTAGGDWSSVNYIFKDTMGEVSTGASDSASYRLRAGYQEMLEVYLSVSAPDDASLTPAIPGITGGTADGSVTWKVIADGSSGFNMKVKASTIPAMKLDAGYYFDDYTSGSEGVPDYNWSVDSNNAEFGFTVEPATGSDAVQSFLDNASSACNQPEGSQTVNKCWLDFNGTENINVVNRAVRTSQSGEDEVIKFRAQSNAKFLKEGNYAAIITTTVSSN